MRINKKMMICSLLECDREHFELRIGELSLLSSQEVRISSLEAYFEQFNKAVSLYTYQFDTGVTGKMIVDWENKYLTLFKSKFH